MKNKIASRSTSLIGGWTEPELVHLVLGRCPEFTHDQNINELRGKIRAYIDNEGRNTQTFYEAILKDLNDANPLKWKRMVIKVLLDNLGVWLPENYYCSLPVVRPYVIRDSRCRDRIHDEWSKPDQRGYLRDDNSLVKAIVKSMPVSGWRIDIPSGNRLKGGFTASHVWRQDVDYETDDDLVSRDPDLNTFVPNLVWLPTEISKMTDREGEFAQRYIQAVSIKLFRTVVVPQDIRTVVEDIWKRLPPPQDVGVELPAVDAIARFVVSARLVGNKIKDINVVAKAVDTILQRGRLPAGRGCVASRYSRYLPGVPRPALEDLFKRLQGYVGAIGRYDANVKLQRFTKFEKREDGFAADIMPYAGRKDVPAKRIAKAAVNVKAGKVCRTQQRKKAGGQDGHYKASHQVNLRLRGYLRTLCPEHRDVVDLCNLVYTHATFAISKYNVLVPQGRDFERRRYYRGKDDPLTIGGASYWLTNEWSAKSLLLLKDWLDNRGVAP